DGLVALAQRLAGGSARETQPDQVISTARQRFVVPDRSGLPGLAQYARLVAGPGDQRLAGYTEASRGCKHLCRHCPVVPVYNGRFRIVPREVVLADIDRQVEAGARHITFGDPDFLNGPRHALALLDELHQRFPTLTYDVTVKVEHLLRHAALLPTLKQTGCLFITSAVESLDDAVLARLAKGHTRSDVEAVVRLFEHVGLALAPTFVTFTPWTTPASYFDLLETLVEWNLVEHVAPIQYAIRLLIPAASRLLELPEVRELVAPFDREALAYPWAHPDPRMDALYEAVREIVKTASPHDDRRSVFSRVWQAAQAAAGHGARPPAWCTGFAPQTPIPFISEGWYC
ncbi:MAG TPA: radical SAM protein, partial [Dehalococcoidia bacterium]|nr:radical SAM protein [Dehalococcoidia bacterium]